MTKVKTPEQKAAEKAAKAAAKGKVAPTTPGQPVPVPANDKPAIPPTPTDQAFHRSNGCPPVKAVKGTKKVTFTLHSGATRVFSEDLHGEDFAATADEFHATNAKSDKARSERKDHVVGRIDE